ncbi:glycosyltransferase family 4 protein [Haladaptatus halobius]|uniref:glycosyltransferase family 4 protein n=1 Tax=Haladaptatus halobius TaxID=2884875 RepID=UPI001D0AB150|nr:glycosyltransferase family 1 protein [Haladaptatus halobius]
MKIGINARTFDVTEPSGAIQSSIRLTQMLHERVDETVLFGSDNLTNHYPNMDVESTFYPSSSQMYGVLWERTILPLKAQQQNIDILYAPNGNGPLHRTPFPTVMCIHDVNAQKGMSSGIHQLYRRTAVPFGANSADIITTVSEFSKQEIHEILGIPKSKIKVVYNGIDPFFRAEGNTQALSLPDKFILFVGALNPRKNIERAIKAFKAAKNRGNLEHKMVIIGPKNKSIFKNLSVEETDDIIIPGFVSKGELKFAYTAADLFLYPSLYEGFGLPPLEALACGTPVVASSSSALPEVLCDAAELPDPYATNEICKSMLRILENPEYGTELVQRGKARVAKFTWENALSSLLDVFREVRRSR